VMKIKELRVFCNCCPVILFLCHEILLSFKVVRCAAQFSCNTPIHASFLK
jgi:hypothetical protein